MQLRELMKRRILEDQREKLEREAFEILSARVQGHGDSANVNARKRREEILGEAVAELKQIERQFLYEKLKPGGSPKPVNPHEAERKRISQRIRECVAEEEWDRLQHKVRQALRKEIVAVVKKELHTILNRKAAEVSAKKQSALKSEISQKHASYVGNEYDTCINAINAARKALQNSGVLKAFIALVLKMEGDGAKFGGAAPNPERTTILIARLEILLKGLNACFDSIEDQLKILFINGSSTMSKIDTFQAHHNRSDSSQRNAGERMNAGECKW